MLLVSKHPFGLIREISEMLAAFDSEDTAQPSAARSDCSGLLLSQAFYTIRSERQANGAARLQPALSLLCRCHGG
jgi:hypothetical protein